MTLSVVESFFITGRNILHGNKKSVSNPRALDSKIDVAKLEKRLTAAVNNMSLQECVDCAILYHRHMQSLRSHAVRDRVHYPDQPQGRLMAVQDVEIVGQALIDVIFKKHKLYPILETGSETAIHKNDDVGVLVGNLVMAVALKEKKPIKEAHRLKEDFKNREHITDDRLSSRLLRDVMDCLEALKEKPSRRLPKYPDNRRFMLVLQA